LEKEEFYERERKRMVEQLISEGVLKSDKVIKAMLRVPREEFVLPSYRKYAYVDSPLPIPGGQTISAPHMVAMMCEHADFEVGHRVLEIGTGSGYHAAVIAEIVAPSDLDKSSWGHVYSVERLRELVIFAKNNIEKAGYSNRVTIIEGDGTLGYPREAPYDRIIVTAGAPRPPRPLMEQLKVGGKMVIPIGSKHYQELVIISRMGEDKYECEKSVPCVFVPLVGAFGWKTS